MNRSNVAATAGAMVVRPGEGKTFRWGPKGTVRIIAGASTTDGSFSIVESTEPPGSGAPLHVHHGEAEAFYILDGAVQLTCGDENGHGPCWRFRLHAQGRAAQVRSCRRQAGPYADAVFAPRVRKVLCRGRLSARPAAARPAESRCFPAAGRKIRHGTA